MGAVQYVIYLTRNKITGKIYIGQDKYNRPNYLGSGYKINEAIKKYGRENFTKEILEYCSTAEQTDEREIYWIEFYNSRDSEVGYNLARGGRSRGKVRKKGEYKHSEVALRKIKESALLRKGKPSWNVGLKYNDEQKRNFHKPKSEAHKANLRGRKISDKTIEAIKKANTGRISYNRKPVLQLSKDGTIIKEWDYITEITKKLGLRASDIARCCKGINKSCGGYKWQYKN